MSRRWHSPGRLQVAQISSSHHATSVCPAPNTITQSIGSNFRNPASASLALVSFCSLASCLKNFTAAKTVVPSAKSCPSKNISLSLTVTATSKASTEAMSLRLLCAHDTRLSQACAYDRSLAVVTLRRSKKVVPKKSLSSWHHVSCPNLVCAASSSRILQSPAARSKPSTLRALDGGSAGFTSEGTQRGTNCAPVANSRAATFGQCQGGVIESVSTRCLRSWFFVDLARCWPNQTSTLPSRTAVGSSRLQGAESTFCQPVPMKSKGTSPEKPSVSCSARGVARLKLPSVSPSPSCTGSGMPAISDSLSREKRHRSHTPPMTRISATSRSPETTPLPQ
eukprot:s768_g17.t1